MTITHIALVIALVAWLIQFVAWRREIVTRQQTELQLREAQWRLANNHPALRNRRLPEWMRLEGGPDE